MKLSLNWLKEYVTLDESPEQIREALTMIGFEVEGVEQRGLPPIENLVVGEVLEFQQHPNADRLRVCRVRAGSDDTRTIVCGAKNFQAGDRVAVALPGAVLPGGMTIARSTLRGVESEGMMCSARELGLGEEHSGIMILDREAEVGRPLQQVLGEGDVVFDLEVTPNRPDCLSHLGLARELAAWFRRDLRFPVIRTAECDPFATAAVAPLIGTVASEVPRECPHYRAYSIRNLKVGPSPQWLQDRLEAIGLRPINNVVDVTNFVLHELGQPLHAFDAAKVDPAGIVVRAAQAGEVLRTLDGRERALSAGMTLITDARRILAVGGVMGGEDSQVDASTRDVILESAWFNPPGIRATARALGLSSDSSYRFERGVDPRAAEYAALRALDLIQALAGGESAGPPLVAGGPLLLEKEIRFSPAYLNRCLGFEISPRDAQDALEALQLTVVEEEDGEGQPVWQVGIPSFRLDLDRPADLVEEVLRIHGTDKIPGGAPVGPTLVASDDPIPGYLGSARQFLSARGFDECIHYSMRSEEETVRWAGAEAAPLLRLANPLASDQSHLRPSLVPGLLDALRLNLNRRNNPQALFEAGRVFRVREGQVWEAVAVAFVTISPAQDKSWLSRPDPDFHHTARLVAELLALSPIGFSTLPRSVTAESAWQVGHAATVGSLAKGVEAQYGLLDLGLTRGADLPGRVQAGEIVFLPESLQRVGKRPRYVNFSPFPDAERDIALIAPVSVPAERVRGELVTAARKTVGPGFALESVRLFDVYEGAGVPPECRSLAFSLRYRSAERTLTDEEVNAAVTALRRKVSEAGNYQVR